MKLLPSFHGWKSQIVSQLYPLVLLSIFDISYSVHSQLLAKLLVATFLLFIPGLVLLGSSRKTIKSNWEKVSISLALSIIFLMVIGLGVDLILPYTFNIANPLANRYMLPAINIFYLIAVFINRKHSWNLNLGKFPKISTQKWPLTTMQILATIFLTLSICGALILNNGGSNLVALIAQISLVIILLAIFIVRKKIGKAGYSYILFSSALGLLYSFSLRGGPYILGFDINEEYRTLLATASKNQWIIGALHHNPYNACLSLTVLPTVLHNLSNIDSVTILKVIYPFMFAFVPLIIFLIANKFLNHFYSFMASLLFMSQIEFANEFPALARQEVALLFVATLFLVLFIHEIKSNQKKILAFVLISGCTLSHYSTAYTLTAILLFFLVINYVMRKIGHRVIGKSVAPSINHAPISVTVVLFSVLLLILWNLQLTQTNKNFDSVLSSSILNINKMFDDGSHSSAAISSLGLGQQLPTQSEIDRYVNNINTTNSGKRLNLYGNANQFPVTLLPIESIGPKEQVQSIANYIYDLVELSDKIIKIVLVIGILLLIYKYRELQESSNKRTLSLLCLSSSVVLLLFAILPDLSNAYGYGRLLCEALIILGIPFVMGFKLLTAKLKKLQDPIMYSVIVTYFSITFGLFTQVFGGNPSVTLNNSGDKYNYYIHKGEVTGIDWTTTNARNQTVFADIYSQLRFESMSDINLSEVDYNVIPTAITQDSYVYMRKVNLNGRGTLYGFNYFSQGLVDYTYPLEFLNANKNVVYVNQDSAVSH